MQCYSYKYKINNYRVLVSMQVTKEVLKASSEKVEEINPVYNIYNKIVNLPYPKQKRRL